MCVPDIVPPTNKLPPTLTIPLVTKGPFTCNASSVPLWVIVTVGVLALVLELMIAGVVNVETLGEAHTPSPRKNVNDDAPAPLARFPTGRLPVISAEDRFTGL